MFFNLFPYPAPKCLIHPQLFSDNVYYPHYRWDFFFLFVIKGQTRLGVQLADEVIISHYMYRVTQWGRLGYGREDGIRQTEFINSDRMIYIERQTYMHIGI